MLVNFMMEHLISANLYLGFHLAFRHTSNVRFLMLPKSGIDIFNLSFTTFNLRLALNLLEKIYALRGV